MERSTAENYLAILTRELVPALGCTEPIALAYAAAKAREVLGTFPEHITVACSGNIVKNVKGVVVPNSGGMRGIHVAATLGVVGGEPARELQVLESVTEADIEETRRLLAEDYCECTLAEGVENLYVSVEVFAGGHSASVTIKDHHTNITEIRRDGEVVFTGTAAESAADAPDYDAMTLEGVLEFAETVDVRLVAETLQRQIDMNSAIAETGLKGDFGANVGRTLLECFPDVVDIRARAKAAAGSDARMNGCALPVVINSGSGNQGITASLPVAEYAAELGATKEQLYRALLVSNLCAVYVKHFIGSLSAFCGAVIAAGGAGAGITYLMGGDHGQIENTIVNTLADVGGVICDGAKSSCAAKIASAVDAAILSAKMSMRGRNFRPGEGLVSHLAENSIRNFGYVGRVGMKQTDIEILRTMLRDKEY